METSEPGGNCSKLETSAANVWGNCCNDIRSSTSLTRLCENTHENCTHGLFLERQLAMNPKTTELWKWNCEVKPMGPVENTTTESLQKDVLVMGNNVIFLWCFRDSCHSDYIIRKDNIAYTCYGGEFLDLSRHGKRRQKELADESWIIQQLERLPQYLL